MHLLLTWESHGTLCSEQHRHVFPLTPFLVNGFKRSSCTLSLFVINSYLLA